MQSSINTTYQANSVPPCEAGDRIELRRMGEDDPDPIPELSRGTVQNVTRLVWPGRMTEWQIAVRWDSGRTLSLVWPTDTFRRLRRDEE